MHKLLISEPELADIFYQEVMSAAPQLAAWLTYAGGDITIYSAGWVLGMVREAAKTSRRALPSSSGINLWKGEIISLVLQKDTIMYRAWGGDSQKVGAWLTPFRPTNAISARKGLALPPANSARYVSEVLVPAGTRVQIEIAGPAFGQPGGALQVQLLERIPPKNFGPGEVLPIGLLPPP